MLPSRQSWVRTQDCRYARFFACFIRFPALFLFHSLIRFLRKAGWDRGCSGLARCGPGVARATRLICPNRGGCETRNVGSPPGCPHPCCSNSRNLGSSLGANQSACASRLHSPCPTRLSRKRMVGRLWFYCPLIRILERSAVLCRVENRLSKPRAGLRRGAQEGALSEPETVRATVLGEFATDPRSKIGRADI